MGFYAVDLFEGIWVGVGVAFVSECRCGWRWGWRLRWGCGWGESGCGCMWRWCLGSGGHYCCSFGGFMVLLL